jgi:hypothetical protein
MAISRIFSVSAMTIICLGVLVSGCQGPVAKPSGEPVVKPKSRRVGTGITLAQKFRVDDTTAYKLMIETGRTVKFEGTLDKEPGLTGGENLTRVEMSVSERIVSINDQGTARAKVTITGLKMQEQRAKEGMVIDYDSTRKKDFTNPLGNLIGKSYTIDIGPSGQVGVIDVGEASAAMQGSTDAHKAGNTLVGSASLKELHEITAFPPAEKNTVKLHDKWSNMKNFNFDMMGKKAYERVYSLAKIENRGVNEIAVVDMNALPTTGGPDQAGKEQPANPFAKMFDNAEKYAGELKLDLTTGKVDVYWEDLKTEWIIADPTAQAQPNKQPDVIRMIAVHKHRIERVD